MPTTTAEMYYTILGSVSVQFGPRGPLASLGPQPKLLLGRLLLKPGSLVSVDAIASALWGEEDRKSRRDSVHHAVRSARKALRDDRHDVIVVHGDAYRLVVESPLQVDTERFKLLAARGHALASSRPRTARVVLAEALSAWSGPLLAEFAQPAWAAGHAAELSGIHDRVVFDLNETRLALGEHAELVAELRGQVVEHELDEPLRGQLIRALLGAGRASEALGAFREAVQDLGGAGPQLRLIGERAARGTPHDPPAAGGAVTHRSRGDPRSSAVVLCADIDLGSHAAHDPGVGTMCVIVDRHGGVARPLGDERIVATFEDPDAALQAARVIASDGRLKARVGLHADAIIDLGDHLLGPGPAHCRHLLEAAHRGQVLVSIAVAERTNPSHELRDLGEHRFADLGPEASLYELPHPRGLTFPPPLTLALRPHNLPVQPTRFVGRADDLAMLSGLAAPGALITLTGTGGCGKTRLALQLAASTVSAFSDGVWFVSLAEVAPGSSVGVVAAQIAGQLSVRALPRETLPAAVVRDLADRAALLIVDNCEHVQGACAEFLAALHTRCPGVCVVATSRHRCGIDGERVVMVEPMAIDAASPGELSDAVELLLDRAVPSRTDAVDELVNDAKTICEALDGLPLAIELAAAQIATRGLAGVASDVAMQDFTRALHGYELADPLRPARQRTMDGAIAWSYQLLDEHARRMLRRVSVFRGSFGETEALRVADANPGSGEPEQASTGVPANLREWSMLVAARPLRGDARMRLLEPIRAFAWRLLDEEGALEATREAHADTFLELAIQTAPRLFDEHEQIALEHLTADHDNLRAALAWYVERGRAPEALRLVGALWWLWFSQGHLEEGCRWVERVLKLDEEPTLARVRALRAGSHLSWWRGDFAGCHEYNVALEACAEAIGDEWGRAWAPMGHGAVGMFSDPIGALALFEDSKRRFDAHGCEWEAGYACQLIGAARWFADDEQAAGEAYAEAVEIFERLGHRSVLASTRRGAGLMAARCGSPAAGEIMCLKALELCEAIGDRAGSAQSLNFVASINRDNGELETAARRYADALMLARDVGELWATCWALDGIADIARTRGERELATRLLAQSGHLGSRAGYQPPPHERRLREDDLAALSGTLGDRAFQRALTEGRLMRVGDAVATALAFAAQHI